MVFGPIAPAVASLVSCPSSHAYWRHRRICCFLASRSAGLQQWSSALSRLPLRHWSLVHRPTLTGDTGASAASLLAAQPACNNGLRHYCACRCVTGLLSTVPRLLETPAHLLLPC